MKIDLYEYMKHIIKESVFTFEDSQALGILVDKNKNASIERVANDELYIDLKGEDERSKKRIELEQLKSNGWEAIKITIIMSKNTQTRRVSIIISNDYSIRVVLFGRNLFTLAFNDNKLIEKNYKTKEEKVINPSDFNIDGIIEEISNVVHNAHYLNAWQNRVDELFNIIKPGIILGIMGIEEKLEKTIDEEREKLIYKIVDIDKQINMLKVLRKVYISKLYGLKTSSDIHEKSKIK